MHPMRVLDIDKVVVNIGVGEAGDRLLKAQRLLETLTGQRAVQTLSRQTNRDLGIRRGMPIGTKVTLRGERAERFLKEALWARQHILYRWNFDPEGNLSFGVADYTDFRDRKYDPDIGLFGMDVSVVLRRPGHRVARRRIRPSHVPKRHRTTPREAIAFMEEKFDAEVRS